MNKIIYGKFGGHLKLDLKFRGYDFIIILVYMIVFSALTFLTDNLFLLLTFGLPFIFALPGYLVMLAMYPERHSLKMAERFALILGLSVFLLPSLGLILNFTPFGIKLGPVMVSVVVFSAMVSWVIRYRRKSIPEDKQFPPAIELSKTVVSSRNSSLAMGLYIGIFIVIIGIIYMLVIFAVTPQPSEHFTELYILTDDNEMIEKPVLMTPDETRQFTISVTNHEGEDQDYVIYLRSLEFTGLWLINDSLNSGIRNPGASIGDMNISSVDTLGTSFTFSGNDTFIYNFTLEDGAVLEDTPGVSFSRPGNYRFQLELYKTEDLDVEPDVWVYIIIIVE